MMRRATCQTSMTYCHLLESSIWMPTPWSCYQRVSRHQPQHVASDLSTLPVHHTAIQAHLQDPLMFTWCPCLKSVPMGIRRHHWRTSSNQAELHHPSRLQQPQKSPLPDVPATTKVVARMLELRYRQPKVSSTFRNMLSQQSMTMDLIL